MNCSDWEERIALYLGGDLTGAELGEMERHLGGCIGCQVFASGLKETLVLLRDAHQEPIAESHFTAVRARVRAQIEGRRRRIFAWGMVAVAAVIALVLMTSPRRSTPSNVAVAPLPSQAPAAPRVSVPPESRLRPPEAGSVGAIAAPPPGAGSLASAPRRRSSRLRLAEATESVLMKFETSDPDIIIYWIADKRKGE